ncbi:MAG TPA: HEAT repeat domain-containing protein [Planctomycetota bacterium]|jgi:hypothetical protein
MRIRRKTIVLLLALLAAARLLSGEDDGEMRIGARAEARRSFSGDEINAVAAKLMRLPLPLDMNKPDFAANVWAKDAAAQDLIADARQVPDLYCRLLIPPGQPQAVSRADKNVRLRAAAALGLSRDRRGLLALVNSSVYDPDDSVRMTAAKALRLLDEPVAMRKLVDLACAGDWQRYPWSVRKSACVALKRYGDKAAVERLLHALSYELASGNALDPRNKLRGKGAGLGTDNPLGLADPTPGVQLSEPDLYPVLSATKEITSTTFDHAEKDMKTWLAWWQKEGEKFSFKE